MSHSFQSIALVGRPTDARVADCMLSLADHLYTRGMCALVDPSVGLAFRAGSVLPCPEQAFATRADLIVAIGGDGTLLYAARLVAGHAVPLIGINRGRLGFLTDVSPTSMLEDVDSVLAGRYSEDRRSLLAARLERRGAPPVRALALNDVVVNKWETGRTMDFETSINGRFVNSHNGDGIVIATATGSTAYAMSCGGPIVEPDLDVWVLAPICPHTLSDRPIVVRAGSTIQLRMADRLGSHAQVTCDGTRIGDLGQGDALFVESARAQVTLLHPPGYDYYRLLRSKLHWGRGVHGNDQGGGNDHGNGTDDDRVSCDATITETGTMTGTGGVQRNAAPATGTMNSAGSGANIGADNGRVTRNATTDTDTSTDPIADALNTTNTGSGD